MVRLIDFADVNQVSCWQAINDVVMGGRSSSQVLPTESGTAVFSGKVSLASGGGFASVRCNHLTQPLTGSRGVLIRCFGDGRRYKFNLRSDTSLESVNWQVAFDTDGEWQQLEFLWSAFRPMRHGREVPDAPRFDPAAVVGVGLLIGDRQEGPFRLELAWVDLIPA